MLQFLISLGSFFLVMPIIEYVSHRWFMHHPTLGAKNSVFREHHIEHHIQGRTDSQHVDMHPFQINNGIAMGCILLVVGLVSFQSATVWFFCLMGYAYCWSMIHRASHDVGVPEWPSETWYGRIAIDHHLKHHEQLNGNFGTVFPHTDYLFGTKL